MIDIVPVKEGDFERIWEIFSHVVSTGDTYIYPPDTTKEQARKIWLDGTHAYVAKDGENIIGTFVIRPNKVGLGSHVCNAGFMVCKNARGKGVGRAMGEYALKEAKKLGYHSIQFNMVVSTNKVSISLWKSLGFEIIGTVPKAFNHQEHGLVDVYIMHKFL